MRGMLGDERVGIVERVGEEGGCRVAFERIAYQGGKFVAC